MVVRVNDFREINTKANRIYRNYYGVFRLVGDGKISSSFCGVYRSIDGCIRVDLHKGKKWNGKDCTGKVYVRKIHMSCKKSSCPTCFKHGWAIRQAGNVENRLGGISKKYDLEVEHIVVSVPKRDYNLGIINYKALRSKVMYVMKVRGIVGGAMIFHAYRLDKKARPKIWYRSPHFHVLGFVDGNYKCRGCTKNCVDVACHGFEALTREEFKKDGYIVKVMPKRKTVFGTAWYQLNHSSYKFGVNRFHICTWFGICAHRVFKSSPVVKQKKECPICSYEVENLVYLGNFPYYEKWRREKCSFGEPNEFLFSYREDGRIAWGLDERRRKVK